MWTLARKTLAKEPGRLTISIAGVAFAVAFMILLRGLYVAYDERVSDFYGALGVDAWVLQSGTGDKLTESRLARKLEGQLRDLPGVAAVTPWKAKHTTFNLHGDTVALYIAGFEQTSGAPDTGPLRMEQGRRTIGDDEIILDEVFARKQGLEVGDVLVVRGQRLTVAGISSGGDLVTFQYGYVTEKRADELFDVGGKANAYLLQLEPGADLAGVTAAVQRIADDVDVKSAAWILKRNSRIVREGFLPVVGVLLALGFFVGVAVIGLTIFSAVLEHRRDYGVMKAIGARPLQMLVVVAVQALSAAAAGYAVGLGAALLVVWAAEAWVPQFITHIMPGDLVLVGVAAIVMGLVAALAPMRRIARLDPAIVFRA